ncbi:MAG: hypothetical protein JJU09_10050 [Rhodobacteraceae bacterium]|nr:hypothetical protein [Paracoccaceae bacterium]
MIILLGMLGGGYWGYASARKQGGDRKDMAQYAAVGLIVGGLVGLFVTIAVEYSF